MRRTASPTVATALACVSFASLVWAARRHFSSDEVPKRMRVVAVLTVGAFGWYFVERRRQSGRSPAKDFVGSGFMCAHLGLFWWAVATTRRLKLTLAFSNDLPTHLVDRGPYAWVRHPFYASYLLFWTAAAIETTPLFLVVPFAMALLYMQAARREERKFARSPIAAEYARYRSVTGMMFPRRRS